MPQVFDVTDFGASGIATSTIHRVLSPRRWKFLHFRDPVTATIHDRRTADQPLDSIAIQAAIDAAHVRGGGTVYIPAGDYLIGPIRLLSRICLQLNAGARLWGSPRLADYFESVGQDRRSDCAIDQAFNRQKQGLSRPGLRRLISAFDADDVAITGGGQISGQAPEWTFPWLNSGSEAWLHDRPSDLILFERCRRVRLQDVRLLDSAAWTAVFSGCDGVRIAGVQIHAFDTPNADGLDLHNSSNVTVSDCRIHCMDDAICLKNSVPNATMRNIVVTNCIIRTLCNAIKVGTDTVGNCENVTVSNIVIHNDDTDVAPAIGGINLNAVDGGVTRGINIANIVMRNAECPIYLFAGCRTANQERYREPRPGRLEEVAISNVIAAGARYPCFIVGNRRSFVRGVTLRDISIDKPHGAVTSSPGPVPERPDAYPSPHMFGSRQIGDQLPAHGLYARFARQVLVRNFRSRPSSNEVRPPIVADEAEVDLQA